MTKEKGNENSDSIFLFNLVVVKKRLETILSL